MQTNIKSILVSLVFLFLGMLFFFLLRIMSFPIEINRFGMALIAIVILYFLSRAFLRFENIPLSVVHLFPNKSTITRLSMGLMIGAFIVGLMLLALFTLTELGIERNTTQTLLPFLLASLVVIPLALMEEILFRGYPFFRLSQNLNIRWVILITAVLFALYHYNPSQNIANLFLGPGIWGVAFGVAAYLSKSIAVPLGIHISANVLQALFGLKAGFDPIWEVTKSTSLAATIDPDQLGLIMQIVLLIVSIIVLEFSIKKKKLIRLKEANIQSKLSTKTVLENK